MAAIAQFLALIVMPLIWWPVVAVGIYVYWTNRSFPLLLVVLGSLLLGILGLMSLLSRPNASYDAGGNAKIYAIGLLPIDLYIIISAIGALLIVVGLVILFLRMSRPRSDT